MKKMLKIVSLLLLSYFVKGSCEPYNVSLTTILPLLRDDLKDSTMTKDNNFYRLTFMTKTKCK